MPTESKPAALEETLALYGDVQRALNVFEERCQEFLVDCHERVQGTLRAAGLEVADAVNKADTWENEWNYWCYARKSVIRLGSLADAHKADVFLYLGWSRSPESDARAAPFAYIEINYSKVRDRRGWKRFMGQVSDLLPPGVTPERTVDYFAVMRTESQDSTYRRRSEDLGADFEFLAGALASALKVASRKVAKDK